MHSPEASQWRQLTKRPTRNGNVLVYKYVCVCTWYVYMLWVYSLNNDNNTSAYNIMLYYIWVQRTGNACAVQTVLLLVFVLYRVVGNINKNLPPRTAYYIVYYDMLQGRHYSGCGIYNYMCGIRVNVLYYRAYR